MANSEGPVIEMTPDGRFVEPPKPSIGGIIARLIMLGLFLAVAAAVFWTMLFVIPVLMLMGVVGYFVARSQMRRF